MEEELLSGGVANAGAVTRIGGHVLRPAIPRSEAIHSFLRALRAAGFDGASEPIGIDPDGRERLVFIEGDVAIPPFPAWVQTDDALASVATLMRRFHDTYRRIGLGAGSTWNMGAGPTGGPIVCHNDVCWENVVFRDGHAVGMLDWDFAAPGRPISDLASCARMCIPIDDDFDAARLGFVPADRPARFRLAADSYGLTRDERRELVPALADVLAKYDAFVRRRVDAGDANFTATWNAAGGAERFDRRLRWWQEHEAQFARAMT